MKIDCKLCIESNSQHLQQIYTGFSELEKKGFVNLTLEKASHYTDSALLRAEVNNKYRVIYDLYDGFNYPGCVGQEENLDFLSGLLDQADYFFKRSYSTAIQLSLKEKNKVQPLGLSYFVSSKNNFGNTITNGLRDHGINLLRKSEFLSNILGITSNRSLYFEQFEHFPIISRKPGILFMARAWDPRDCSGCNPDDIELMNVMRANCIITCRQEFGDLFYGGFARNDYAIRNYPDVLLDNPKASRKIDYLKAIKKADICVATTGLHDSIGWKLAEYVAASKAIVSEKLHYELPGVFKQRQNYLEFATPEECAQSIRELINDKALRFTLMTNNYRYYNTHLRPDALVMNTLLKITGQTEF